MTTPDTHHDHDHDPQVHGHSHDHDDHPPGHSHDHDDHDERAGHSHGPDGHSHPTGVKGFFLSIFKPHSHDAADSIDDALESNTAGIRAVKISLIALGITAIAQLLVVIVTGSVALLADTIHNFSDALTAVPLWIAFVLARRKPTRRYTYGYGRAEDLRRPVHRRHDHFVGHPGRLRVDPTADRPTADHPCLGRFRCRADRLCRQRTRCRVPHPGRPADRLSRPGCRRPACPHGRLHLTRRRDRRRRASCSDSHSPIRSSAS